MSERSELATLSEVLEPIALAQHLRAVARAPWNRAAIEEVRVRVLKHYIGRRCTLEISLRSKEKWHFLIGKVYRKDRSNIFQVMEGVQQAGFGPHDEFSIPEPIAYLPSLRLLLQEKVEGPLADEIFKTGDEKHRAAAAEKCGLWLARFHTHAPKLGSISYARDHIDSDSMQRCSRELARLGGHLAGKVARLLQRLEDAASSLSPVEMRLGHGGYRATHVILVSGRTVTFDLDTYDIADPGRDLARFLSALRSQALGQLGAIRALDGAAEVFLETYLAAGPPGARQNLCFFEAAACLKRAKHCVDRSLPHWQEKTEVMLDEGLRILELGAA